MKNRIEYNIRVAETIMRVSISFGLFTFFLFAGALNIWAQDKQAPQDTTYYQDYSDKLLFRIYTITKFNSLTIENTETGKSLELLPNGQTNLGVGFNYKHFGLGLAFGIPISTGSTKKYGETKRLDVQGSMYGNKFGGDGYFQVYKGYYNSNPQDFIEWDNENLPQLPSMRIMSIGVTGFFFHNAEKYSYRAAFVRDEVQYKSAGSFTIGFFANYDETKTDQGFIPQEFPDSARAKIDLKEFTALAFGASLGYAHNFVIREKVIVGLAIIPGFGYQRINIVNIDDSTGSEDQPAGQLLTRASIGYEHSKFFLGLTGSVNFRNLDFAPYNFRLATEQIRFILGKRFTVN